MKNESLINDSTESIKTLRDVFSLFCVTGTNPVMQLPFEINGKIYATDSYTLIRCNKSDCDFEINNPYTPPNCERVMPLAEIEKVLSIDKSTFEQYKVDVYIDEDVECDICNGYGEVEWEFQGYTKEDECPACDGSGSKTKIKSVKTGKKIFGNFHVKLNETYFTINIFYKLIQARDFLGGEITLLYQANSKSAVLFKVGFCEILLMPYNFDITDSDGVLNIT